MVVAVHVTLRAQQAGMRTHQGKAGGGMVEGPAAPVCGVVALLASLREIRLHVVGVGRLLVIRQVTRHARRVSQLVIVIDVALGTLKAGVSPGEGKACSCMVEASTVPGAGIVALLATLRETRLHVIGIGRFLIIRQVAGNTRRVRAGQVVIPIDVTLRTLETRMGAGQGESCAGVVKGSATPVGRVVALLTGLREICADVIRVGRGLVILQVASHARRVREVVIVVDVTLRALQGGVSARQRESGIRVVECRRLPGCGVMAGIASLGETLLGMIGIIRALVVLQMASDARLASEIVVSIGMALTALQGGVRSGQRKAHEVVVESRRLPGRGRMTCLTGLRHAGGDVVRIRRALVVLHVTTHTIRGGAFVAAANVTIRTGKSCVHAGERKAGVLQVIEACAEPGIHAAVALLASRGKSRRDVCGRRRLLVIPGMAGVALGGESLELSGGGALVA